MLRWMPWIMLGLVSTGCGRSEVPAPVELVPVSSGVAQPIEGISDPYRVKRGDTLYSIAFNAGQDVATLAAYNQLVYPYTLHPEQLIRLSAPAVPVVPLAPLSSPYQVQAGDTLYRIAQGWGLPVEAVAAQNHLNPPYTLVVGQSLLKPQGAVVTETVRPPVLPVKPLPKPPLIANGAIRWQWPVKGTLLAGFSTAERGNKGIDLSGQQGQPVYAAAPGTVVYAGNGLRGYGNLIIIKHNADYLSAYAHNDRLNVGEGDVVTQHTAVAAMGKTDSVDVRLHFEIRYRGKSVNPLTYLPPLP